MSEQTQAIHLSRAARRDTIRGYLKQYPERSNGWVAKDCRTTDKTVEAIRRRLEAASEIPKMERLVDMAGVERPRKVNRPAKPAPLLEVRIIVQDDRQAIISTLKGKKF